MKTSITHRSSVLLILSLVACGCGHRSMSYSEIAKFADSPKDFKGTTLTLEVTYNGKLPLREYVADNGVDTGGYPLAIPFSRRASEGGKAVNIEFGLSIPKDISVPNVQPFDNVVVTFKCEKGSLYAGNKVTKISR